MRFFYLNAPPAARTNWEKRARTSPCARFRPHVNIFMGGWRERRATLFNGGWEKKRGRGEEKKKEEREGKNDRTTPAIHLRTAIFLCTFFFHTPFWKAPNLTNERAGFVSRHDRRWVSIRENNVFSTTVFLPLSFVLLLVDFFTLLFFY